MRIKGSDYSRFRDSGIPGFQDSRIPDSRYSRFQDSRFQDSRFQIFQIPGFQDSGIPGFRDSEILRSKESVGRIDGVCGAHARTMAPREAKMNPAVNLEQFKRACEIR
ncbi:MAG: hypothetical protein IPJ30_27780 [Acidobacteria bacterium]|nr:hypothetical protein [Acidobacteriota bacterium]